MPNRGTKETDIEVGYYVQARSKLDSCADLFGVVVSLGRCLNSRPHAACKRAPARFGLSKRVVMSPRNRGGGGGVSPRELSVRLFGLGHRLRRQA